ncbi:exodeoxyribonuclease V subunit gamma, partial [Lachnospiraceae bacterium OttesenSCG-928-D06]|nr:exodeoxyribonuclease V subunit gamma [Lachnospiraceae bacterium OttesenSCG-928-D06]
MKDQLKTLGGHIHKQGYINEVKSAISEFMQYGIGTEDVAKLIAFSEKRGALVHKLKDLQILYKGFMEYINGKFITTEETLDILRKRLHLSKLLPGSVVVFDGFTGFTPIQNKVIQDIMGLSKETIVTITIGARENPYLLCGEQKLFHLSKKTVSTLEKLGKEAGVKRERDIFFMTDISGEKKELPEKWNKSYESKCEIRYNHNHRFMNSKALLFLEENLFRYTNTCFAEKQDNIHIFETSSQKEEVHQTGLLILERIRTDNLAYRDIAVISGDLLGYAPFIAMEFAEMGIPFFMDRTSSIILNPMIEYIKSALELFLKDFSYESVFHYLRSGLSDITKEEADELENYVIQTGIRGFSRYNKMFTHKIRQMKEDESKLIHLNDIRERMMKQISCLFPCKSGDRSVKDYVNCIYDFLVENNVQQKLYTYEMLFKQQNDETRVREYAQIYRLVMELLNQIYSLLGEESISLKEFLDILEAGFSEIEVGTIPQNVDRVVVGDIERSRLKQVKVLFFLGVNDGNIPKNAGKGGIISDIDREFLRESEMELAPSPRQQMYIQRLYLYLNMTKPSYYLYLSYSKVNSSGKSLRPAYLIDVMEKMFPEIKVEYPENRQMLEQVVSLEEGLSYLAEGLRCYVEGALDEGKIKNFYALYHVYGESIEGRTKRKALTEAAFFRYEESGLSKLVARALYGVNLENSVSRLETYAACAYRHFLQYGLSLREREAFEFENVDMGNVFHGVLELFARGLEQSPYTWFDFPEEFGEKEVTKAVEEYAALYGETILYSSARNEYMIRRMERILTRTVLTLQNQLKQGEFKPDGYELSFHYAEDLESVNISLSEDEKMRLRGRIDRIDVAETDQAVYVKVIDYKSGVHHFDLAALYYGLQLQLVVYMNAALEVEKAKHPDKEVVPAALLYYRIEDPTVETLVELSEEELKEQIMAKLRMNGVVNAREDIVSKLDRYMESKSNVIPVERKKDGSFSARSSVMSEEELKVVSDYVNHKVRSIGQEILNGEIALNPYEKGLEKACTYCA